MRRLLITGALVCALFTVAFAGPPVSPGDDPCIPTPEVPCPTDDESANSSSTSGSFITVLINGVLTIVYLP